MNGRTDFAPIATALGKAVAEFGAGNSRRSADARERTVKTNSEAIGARGDLLLDLLNKASGRGVQGLTLADLGAGFGALSAYFAAAGAHVTAVDVNRSHLEIGKSVAHDFGLPIQLVESRMEAPLPLDSESFDVVVQNNSFCYLTDPIDRASAIHESHRILKPGGWLIRRDPSRTAPVDPFTGLPLLHLLPPNAATRVAERLGRRRPPVRLVSYHRARRELSSAGFRCLPWREPSTGRRGLTARMLGLHHNVVAQRLPDEVACDG